MNVSDEEEEEASMPPMHHVKRSLTPRLADLAPGAGAGRRSTSIASTRLRFVFGMPCRKIDFQTWLATIEFCI